MTNTKLVQHIKNLKDLGADIRGEIPKDRAEAEAYESAVRARLSNLTKDQGSLAAGTLRIYVVQDPEKWDYRINDVDRYLDDFTGLEWIALFRDVLGCPMTSTSLAKEGVPLEDQFRLEFQGAIPEYPLLGRMWNTFGDSVYAPKEVSKLRLECVHAMTLTSDEQARSGLSKLVQACNDAVENRLGMYLASD